MKTLSFLLLILATFSAQSQTTSYNDVAVIVNDNSQVSLNIGEYFKQARNIPDENIIHVYGPTDELIDSTQFEQIRAQIEYHLVSLNLVDSINYLVTTKGLPLRINSGCILDTIFGTPCASFDSELTVILGSNSSSIGTWVHASNPLYDTTAHFSREAFDIFLVTRLDGYTEQDVFNLIDRSGPQVGVNQSSAQGVVDISNSDTGDSIYFSNIFVPAYDYLTNNSWNATLDSETEVLINQDNVFGYFGIGHGPVSSVPMNYTWTKGSFGVMAMCNSAYTFDSQVKGPNEILIGDLIAGGCTGALGNVDLVFFSQIMNPEILVSRYLDPIETYNLAESFYMSIKQLSWQAVVIGDPKASLVLDNLANTIELDQASVLIYPNPSQGNVKIKGSEMIRSIVVYDMKGAVVKSVDQVMNTAFDLDLYDLNNGVYTVQVEMDGNIIRERIVLQR